MVKMTNKIENLLGALRLFLEKLLHGGTSHLRAGHYLSPPSSLLSSDICVRSILRGFTIMLYDAAQIS